METVMTSRVNVDAHAHPVRVTMKAPNGEVEEFHLEPHVNQNFFVTEGKVLTVEELSQNFFVTEGKVLTFEEASPKEEPATPPVEETKTKGRVQTEEKVG
jgi:hypothetical protein